MSGREKRTCSYLSLFRIPSHSSPHPLLILFSHAMFLSEIISQVNKRKNDMKTSLFSAVLWWHEWWHKRIWFTFPFSGLFKERKFSSVLSHINKTCRWYGIEGCSWYLCKYYEHHHEKELDSCLSSPEVPLKSSNSFNDRFRRQSEPEIPMQTMNSSNKLSICLYHYDPFENNEKWNSITGETVGQQEEFEVHEVPPYRVRHFCYHLDSPHHVCFSGNLIPYDMISRCMIFLYYSAGVSTPPLEPIGVEYFRGIHPF